MKVKICHLGKVTEEKALALSLTLLLFPIIFKVPFKNQENFSAKFKKL
jgi:ACR3 family arsenite efflux pump ArsB